MANDATVVSSLAEVQAALQNLNIIHPGQANLVRFRLDEQSPLQAAALLKMKTRPGRLGFRLINPELMECKYRAKMKLETAINRVFRTSIAGIDDDLRRIGESIAALRVLVNIPDDGIPHRGPALDQRNRGVEHVIYPCPPFLDEPDFEHNNHQNRVPYQHPYEDKADFVAARARDRRAQRAVWIVHLRIMEQRQSILQKFRTEMQTLFIEEMRSVLEDRSDLGAGYADYDTPPLA